MGQVKRTAAAVTGAVALVVALGVAGLAAATPTTSPNPSDTAGPSAASTEPPGKRHGGPDKHGGLNGRAGALAEKLDLDRAAVAAALREYRKANKRAADSTRPARDTALAEALAAKLGVSESEVTKAVAEVRAERKAVRGAPRGAAREQRVADRLAAAVKAGTLTQAEADAVKKAVDAGIVRVGGR